MISYFNSKKISQSFHFFSRKVLFEITFVSARAAVFNFRLSQSCCITPSQQNAIYIYNKNDHTRGSVPDKYKMIKVTMLKANACNHNGKLLKLGKKILLNSINYFLEFEDQILPLSNIPGGCFIYTSSYRSLYKKTFLRPTETPANLQQEKNANVVEVSYLTESQSNQ